MKPGWVVMGTCAGILILIGGILIGRRGPAGVTPAGAPEKGRPAAEETVLTPFGKARSPSPPWAARASGAGGVGSAMRGDPPPGAPRVEPGDLPAIRTLLRNALRANDEAMAGYAQGLLTRSLVEDPNRAAELLAWMDRETDPGTLAALAAALGDSGVSGSPAAMAALLKMAQAGDLFDRRQAALGLLARLEVPDAATQAAVLGIARNDPDPRMQVAAVVTAGAWMGRNPAQIDGLSRRLAQVAQASGHEVVRGNAIQAMALLDKPLPDEVLQSMGTWVRTDPSAQNRGLAAMALGGASAAQRGVALQHLEQAYAAERVPEVRRGLLIHVVRAGRSDAPRVLERIAAADAEARQDVADYLEILRSGETDPDRIWAAKFARDAARGTIPGGEEEHHE